LGKAQVTFLVLDMPVYEIKNPAPIAVPAGADPRRTEPVAAVHSVIRVRHLGRRWPQAQPARHKEEGAAAEPDGLTAARQLIEEANVALLNHDVAIHLSLVPHEEFLSLEIYDCTDNLACRVLEDRRIALPELPEFVRRLSREAGLLIDTIT
jgi:hypothetical protein